MKPETGPPMTLGNAAKAELRLIVWCRACGHQVEPDPAELPRHHGCPRRRWCLPSLSQAPVSCAPARFLVTRQREDTIMRKAVSIMALVAAMALGGSAVLANSKGTGGGSGSGSSLPAGFSHGQKQGWQGGNTPPGWNHREKSGWRGIAISGNPLRPGSPPHSGAANPVTPPRPRSPRH